jgi:hypothetical protein
MKHICVLFRNQVYALDVYDPSTGHRIPLKDIESQLWAIVKDVEANPYQPPIPILTADQRDSWSEVRRFISIHNID